MCVQCCLLWGAKETSLPLIIFGDFEDQLPPLFFWTPPLHPPPPTPQSPGLLIFYNSPGCISKKIDIVQFLFKQLAKLIYTTISHNCSLANSPRIFRTLFNSGEMLLYMKHNAYFALQLWQDVLYP